MAYYLSLFSPETYEAFGKSDRSTSGFRKKQEKKAALIRPGDCFLCYMTKMSRWIGVLEVSSDYFLGNDSIFYEEDDPFIVRFNVRPRVWLPKEQTIPIHDKRVWNGLSFTRACEKNSSTWTGKLRGSLSKINDSDAVFLNKILLEQTREPYPYEFDETQYQRYLARPVNRQDRVVSVTVPSDEAASDLPTDSHGIRDSHRIQALLARIGEAMGFTIWLPRNDRGAVLEKWHPAEKVLLDRLPLNYDDVTLGTIEQIDVLWLRRRSIARAFEVEHTTAIYSGILRMADLLALQPNMDIKLHIVAPDERRDKVFQEIRRPVFSLLERAPLSECCTFVSYGSLEELSGDHHLSHLSDTVLDEYAEEAE
uniref:EVE domain-containing protein n=1 Tax=Candidatus Kentrum sp. FM TaxID=2126340 RepID=A0A450TKX8_9GAMM|nr:MAG: hypothetical protein BECKFM1743A_GA0114220_104203 [Candidatus Kentron sp. FM]VFJ68339.1 MAG: hypothetical protein BECKFM1743C_GA0114222_104833 [Candidatus Kentron sp. FM]VFK16379.1 MAG: hypothetical protein BECKFM1743B_GA0114221_104163 [Candidatus Kentron sp. FM]